MISYQTSAPGAPLIEVESKTPEPQGSEAVSYTHLTLPTNREV